MKAIRILFFFLFLIPFACDAVVKGSQIAVSVEPAALFPAADTDNTMLGFGWFKNGFTLEDNTTTCTFDSVYPVSGAIDMNGGTLYLLQDLILRNVLQLNELGTIYGNNHILDLCNVPDLPPDQIIIHDLKVELHHDLIITNTVLIKGNCEICGFGKNINLVGDGKLLIDSNSHLILCTAELRGITGEKVSCVDDSGSLTLDNVKWIQDDYTEFKKGSILFKDHVEMVGSSTFAYSSIQTSTIGVSSCFHIYSDMRICLGRDTQTGNEPLAFVDDSSCLHLDDCDFIINSSGICLTKGTISLAKEVSIEALGTTTQTGLIIGDGTLENDMTVWFEPGAAVTHNQGYWVYNNSQKDLLKSASKTSRMIRNLGSKIYVPHDLEINDITVQLNSNYIDPIVVEPGVQLSYLNAAVNLPDVDFEITSDQLNAWTYCLNGNDSLFLSKGTLPLYVVAMGSDNQLRGNGGFMGGITLLNSASDLSCGINGYIDNAIALNEGNFILTYDLLLRNNGSITGPGTVNLGANTLNVLRGSGINSSIYWESDGGSILLNNKLTLTQTWTIHGNCSIKGNNAKLVLGDGGNIVLEEGASLTLRNLPIYGVKDSNIRCLDDAGIVTLLKSDLNLLGDYLFDKGSMNFYLENGVSGAYTFSYDSVMSSTIRQDGILCFSGNSTLAIGKKNGQSSLGLEDNSAILKFNNANLQTNETGFQITTGKLIVDGKVSLDMLGTSSQTGFIVGDGDPDHDVEMYLMPAMVVSHNSGYWVYNNASPNKIISTSPSARLIRNEGSYVYVPKNLTAYNFTVELASLLVPPLQTEAGVIVSYTNAYVKMPGIEFDISSHQLNAYTYNLDGNDSLFITKGTLPLYLLIQNSGNSVIGNGSLSGAITLYDSNAQLVCGINGTIDNLISLNGGTFILSDHLRLGSNANIIGSGIVNLSNKTFTFPINANELNTPIYWISNDGGINLRGSVLLNSTWTIKGKCTLNGINSKFSLGDNAQIIVDSDSELIFENVRVYGLIQDNIKCVDNSGKITLKNSQFVQLDDTIFSHGSMEMYLQNSLSGSYTFSYDSVMTSTIKSDGKFSLKDGVHFITGRNEGNEPFYMQDKTAIIEFQDSQFTVRDTGLRFTRGTIIADHDVVIDVIGTDSTSGLVFGDGIQENDMGLVLNPGATVRFPNGFVQYNLTTPNGIRSKTHTAQLIRGAESHFDLKSDLNLADMTVDVHLLSQLTIDAGKTLSYGNGRIVLPQGTFDLTGVRYNEVTSLLAGDDKIILVNGSMPLATLVAGTGNSIEGNGDVTGPIILSNSAAELSCNLNGAILSNITLNGGTVALLNDLHLANGIKLSGNGIVTLANNNLELGKSDMTWDGILAWSMQGGSLDMHAGITLNNIWTFNGDCTIKGHGHTILMGDSGQIIIGSNSRLCLQDIRLENIRDTNIRCVDNTSLLMLQDVDLKQYTDNSFSFTLGALAIKSDVHLQGNAFFVYETTQTSTIYAESQLVLDTNMTFSYYPMNNDKSLLVFKEDSSKLILNNASLCTTVSGLQLKKGQCIFQGDCVLQNDYIEEVDENGTTIKLQEGITFGANAPCEDCICVVTGGATVSLMQGKVHYCNTKSHSLVMENSASTLKFIKGTIFAFSYDVPLGVGQLVMHEKTLLQPSNDAEIIGAVFVGK